MGTDQTSGATFYYNEQTGESQWEHPSALLQDQYESRWGLPQQGGTQRLPVGWIMGTDQASGATYYYNELTGESRWEPPQQQGAQAAATASTARSAVKQKVPTSTEGALLLVAAPFIVVFLVFFAYILDVLFFQ